MIMFENILVPLDGSKLSEAALEAAAVLAGGLGSSVTLLHVVEEDPPAEVHKERHLRNADEANAYLRDAAPRAFSASTAVKTHVHESPVENVARSIVAHATAEFQPDLIVASTHGRGGMRDLLFGNIAQQIVAQGTTPLLLVKPNSPAFRIGKILLPLDPDSVHDESLPSGEALALAFKAELHLVSIIPTYATLTGEQAAASSLMPATTQAVLDLDDERASGHLKEHVESLTRLGITSAFTVARGDPATAILKTADEAKVDLIILSTHRKAGLGAFWSRSVAPKIAQRTRIPLLLIPLQ
jgi:nucleotide-binding universal stress UspA family protein